MDNWYKLDNAAKLFPSISSINNSSVFRLSAVLNEEINPEILKSAVDFIYKRFPTFFVKLHKGFFWNYLDENKEEFLVEKEKDFPCSFMKKSTNNGYLLKILYYGNRVSVEFFHSVTDGHGAAEFLKTLIFYYLKLSNKPVDDEGKILLVEDKVNLEEQYDSFANYYDVSAKIINDKSIKSYAITGTKFNCSGTNVLSGLVSAAELKKIAKKYNATITSYLIALLIYSIYQTRMKYFNIKKAIVIAVPVNLRNIFPSKTLRNFFSVINIIVTVTPSTALSDIIEMVSNELKEKISKENITAINTNNLKLEKSIFTKIVPLPLKYFFIKLAYNFFGKTKTSISISNINKIIIPKSMEKYISHMEFVLYPNSKGVINTGVCSLNDTLVISFSRIIVETDILQYFFSHLANVDDIEVAVYSNDWGEENE